MLNRAQIIGNLGQDPESRSTEGGGVVVRLSVATNEKFKDRSGEWQEHVEWHRVVVFGKQAETCREYLKKGRRVYVEGNLQTRSWEDKDGVKRYSTEIRAARVLFLDGKGEGKGGGDRPPDDWGRGKGEGDRGGSGGGGRPPDGWGRDDDRGGKSGGGKSGGGWGGGGSSGSDRGGDGGPDEDIPF